LRVEFPTLAADIDVREQEANGALRDLCGKDWHGHRAVLFLDPYGMQVEWTTIEAVAATRAIDMWLLFPLGIGVNRLVTRSGEIPEPWRRKLDVLLGTETWYDEFYRVEPMPDLLADDRERVVKASMATIGGYFTTRLRTIFSGVAEPGVLRNSVNNPLYLLCFASGSPRGQTIALKIANHLLKELR
jgi:three-Cys-motif partner protein